MPFSDVSAIWSLIRTYTHGVPIRLAANVRLQKVLNIVPKLFHSTTKKKSWLPQAWDNHDHWVSTVTEQPLPVTSVSDAA